MRILMATIVVGVFAVVGVANAGTVCDGPGVTDPATAERAQQIAGSLPLAYGGSFAWDGTSGIQAVFFTFSACTVDGTIGLAGEGFYFDSGTRIDLIAQVDGTHITIFERNPIGGTGAFLTAGRHAGDLAPDLTSICATWVSDGDGATGRLRLGLKPEDARSCGPSPLTS